MCWTIGSLFIGTELSRPFPSSQGMRGIALLYMLIGLVLLILGPVFAHLLVKVHVDAPRIRLDRWFGLIGRTYHENDIKTWSLSSAQKSDGHQVRDPSLILRFADGALVVLTARTVNFHTLHHYLLSQAASREDLRRNSK
jgi:hypothetical protein